jgi:hypothetical protein
MPTVPPPRKLGIVKLRLFHLSMTQFRADRNAFLKPSHMPRLALPIRPGSAFTQLTSWPPLVFTQL